jgi:hypothetical protein
LVNAVFDRNAERIKKITRTAERAQVALRGVVYGCLDMSFSSVEYGGKELRTKGSAGVQLVKSVQRGMAKRTEVNF